MVRLTDSPLLSAADAQREAATVYQLPDGRLIVEHFDGSDVEVQFSRHRFVYAGRPSEGSVWREIQREYRLIKSRRAAVTDL